ncbi:hypothetical protein CFC21_082198 [Triticum aestivum]|uniref:Uncharacterized protein n=2 Tax=Triticum aestivum TaxID=4565 RepID=A0A9R1I6G6_WHEAT|nr:hypothetical protein CFC21_082197 [Triticum aestivum]KAF7077672.1 hypothetical protein CFC21_082198 [Triticum aestivum]
MGSSLEELTKTNVLRPAKRLVGEYQAHRLQDEFVVEDHIKILVRSMAKDLERHHDQGHCLAAFDHRNIQINDKGRGKITGVAYIEKSDVDIKNNYLDLHNVVLNTVFRHFSLKEQLPRERRMLLLLMRKECIGKEYLIRNNVALMPIQLRVLFFQTAYEHVMFFLRDDPAKQKRILDRLPYLNNWTDLLRGNTLLEASLAHKSHDKTTAEGFFTYYRDSNSHRLDRCHLLRTVGCYTAKQFEMNLMVGYTLYLAMLEDSLDKEGELEKLEVHVMF